jgi:hypothetical protein
VDAKSFTNAETTDRYLGFRSLGSKSSKISSDNSKGEPTREHEDGHTSGKRASRRLEKYAKRNH